MHGSCSLRWFIHQRAFRHTSLSSRECFGRLHQQKQCAATGPRAQNTHHGAFSCNMFPGLPLQQLPHTFVSLARLVFLPGRTSGIGSWDVRVWRENINVPWWMHEVSPLCVCASPDFAFPQGIWLFPVILYVQLAK